MTAPTLHERRPDAEVVVYGDTAPISDAEWHCARLMWARCPLPLIIDARSRGVSADLCAAWKEEGAAAINLLGLDPLSHRPEVRAAVERDQRAKAAVKSAFQKEGRLQAAQRRAFDAWTAAQKALDDARDARDRAGQ